MKHQLEFQKHFPLLSGSVKRARSLDQTSSFFLYGNFIKLLKYSIAHLVRTNQLYEHKTRERNLGNRETLSFPALII